MSILNKIRQRPYEQRKIISLLTAIVLTIIIVAVWFSFSSFGKNQRPGDDSRLSSVSPFQMIREQFSEAFSDLDKGMTALEEVSSSTILLETINSATSTDISTSTGTSTDNVIN
jgi:hypothetical protein